MFLTSQLYCYRFLHPQLKCWSAAYLAVLNQIVQYLHLLHQWYCSPSNFPVSLWHQTHQQTLAEQSLSGFCPEDLSVPTMQDDSVSKWQVESQTITSGGAVIFLVIASGSLLLLFFFLDKAFYVILVSLPELFCLPTGQTRQQG